MKIMAMELASMENVIPTKELGPPIMNKTGTPYKDAKNNSFEDESKEDTQGSDSPEIEDLEGRDVVMKQVRGVKPYPNHSRDQNPIGPK